MATRSEMRCTIGHAGQIVTARWMIIDYMRDIVHSVTYNTVYLIASWLEGHRDARG